MKNTKENEVISNLTTRKTRKVVYEETPVVRLDLSVETAATLLNLLTHIGGCPDGPRGTIHNIETALSRFPEVVGTSTKLVVKYRGTGTALYMDIPEK